MLRTVSTYGREPFKVTGNPPRQIPPALPPSPAPASALPPRLQRPLAANRGSALLLGAKRIGKLFDRCGFLLALFVLSNRDDEENLD